MKPVRIIHSTTVPGTFGFFHGMFRDLQRLGYAVTAISSPGPRLAAFGEQEGCTTWPVDLRRSISPGPDLVTIFRLWRYFRDTKPTVVHAHTPKAGLLCMIAATLARVPVRIYHIHGFPFMTARGWRRWLLRTTERVSATLANQVFSVSEGIREVAIGESICPAPKIRVLLHGSINGIDAAERFNPARITANEVAAIRAAQRLPATAPVIGFVGRLVGDKGIAELHAAWMELRKEFPAVHMVLVGEFEPRDPVPPRLVEMLRADDRIRLADRCGMSRRGIGSSMWWRCPPTGKACLTFHWRRPPWRCPWWPAACPAARRP
jgi:glycosyltransferase involved in cell wall biosynthesis